MGRNKINKLLLLLITNAYFTLHGTNQEVENPEHLDEEELKVVQKEVDRIQNPEQKGMFGEVLTALRQMMYKTTEEQFKDIKAMLSITRTSYMESLKTLKKNIKVLTYNDSSRIRESAEILLYKVQTLNGTEYMIEFMTEIENLITQQEKIIFALKKAKKDLKNSKIEGTLGALGVKAAKFVSPTLSTLRSVVTDVALSRKGLADNDKKFIEAVENINTNVGKLLKKKLKEIFKKLILALDKQNSDTEIKSCLDQLFNTIADITSRMLPDIPESVTNDKLRPIHTGLQEVKDDIEQMKNRIQDLTRENGLLSNVVQEGKEVSDAKLDCQLAVYNYYTMHGDSYFTVHGTRVPKYTADYEAMYSNPEFLGTFSYWEHLILPSCFLTVTLSASTFVLTLSLLVAVVIISGITVSFPPVLVFPPLFISLLSGIIGHELDPRFQNLYELYHKQANMRKYKRIMEQKLKEKEQAEKKRAAQEEQAPASSS